MQSPQQIASALSWQSVLQKNNQPPTIIQSIRLVIAAAAAAAASTMCPHPRPSLPPTPAASSLPHARLLSPPMPLAVNRNLSDGCVGSQTERSSLRNENSRHRPRTLASVWSFVGIYWLCYDSAKSINFTAPIDRLSMKSRTTVCKVSEMCSSVKSYMDVDRSSAVSSIDQI